MYSKQIDRLSIGQHKVALRDRQRDRQTEKEREKERQTETEGGRYMTQIQFKNRKLGWHMFKSPIKKGCDIYLRKTMNYHAHVCLFLLNFKTSILPGKILNLKFCIST